MTRLVALLMILFLAVPCWADGNITIKYVNQWGTRTCRDQAQTDCSIVFNLEDYKKLLEFDLQYQKLEAMVAAKDEIIAMQAAAIKAMQDASVVEDIRYKDLLENRDSINVAYMNELARPKMPYPSWFEPVRITIEVVLSGFVVGLATTTYVLLHR